MVKKQVIFQVEEGLDSSSTLFFSSSWSPNLFSGSDHTFWSLQEDLNYKNVYRRRWRLTLKPPLMFFSGGVPFLKKLILYWVHLQWISVGSFVHPVTQFLINLCLLTLQFFPFAFFFNLVGQLISVIGNSGENTSQTFSFYLNLLISTPLQIFLILTLWDLFKQYSWDLFLKIRQSWLGAPLGLEILLAGYVCALPACLMTERFSEHETKERTFWQAVMPFVICSGRLPSLLFILSSLTLTQPFLLRYVFMILGLFFIYFSNFLFILALYRLAQWLKWISKTDGSKESYVFSSCSKPYQFPSLFHAIRSSYTLLKRFFKTMIKPFFWVFILLIIWGAFPSVFQSQILLFFRSLLEPILYFFHLPESAFLILISGFISREIMAVVLQSFLMQHPGVALSSLWGWEPTLLFIIFLLYMPHCWPTFLLMGRISKKPFMAFSIMLFMMLILLIAAIIFNLWFYGVMR